MWVVQYHLKILMNQYFKVLQQPIFFFGNHLLQRYVNNFYSSHKYNIIFFCKFHDFN